MSVRIERVRPNERKRIAHIRDYIRGKWNISAAEARVYVKPSYGDELPKAWVAVEKDGTIVGHAILVVEPEGFCAVNQAPWLQAVFVNADRRGEAIGRRLVEAVEADARASGYQHLYLDTVDAAAYYEKLGGWEHIGMEYWRRRSVFVAVMRKDLQSNT